MATLNSADSLRILTNDRPRYMIETLYGNGTASTFQISGAPIVSGNTSLGGFQPSAFVTIGAGGTAWSATGATFNYHHGFVSFSSIINANSAFQLMYTYATFSDQEIDQITALYGNFASMQLQIIDTLMADAYRRARWASQRGASYDDTRTMENLMMMRSAIVAEKFVEIGPVLHYDSWWNKQQSVG